jgi:hypothetical protein
VRVYPLAPRRNIQESLSILVVDGQLHVRGPEPAIAEVRQYKLARTTETHNTCPYCSVGCGILMYGLGDGAKNATASIIHIEGDPDHPHCSSGVRSCRVSPCVSRRGTSVSSQSGDNDDSPWCVDGGNRRGVAAPLTS